jgi:chromosome segregation ATPase
MKRNLMNELKEGMDALTEDRHMTRDHLLKDYAAIIDEQKKEIKELQEQLDQHNARVHKLTLEEWRTFDQS